jgi:hypothetical protein
MKGLAIAGILAVSLAAAADALVAREPFAKAHVSMMARAETSRGEPARLAEIDVWAEGTRLRARVRGEPRAGELWIDGLAAEPLRILDGKVVEPARRSLEAGLKLALSASPSLATANSDRVAGHPCKVVTEQLAGGASLTRCIWRGLPLSIELKGRGYSFNAAATLVEEGAVTVADLQPPPGAPAAPASMSAGR